MGGSSRMNGVKAKNATLARKRERAQASAGNLVNRQRGRPDAHDADADADSRAALEAPS